jgi:hypothetical protein
MDNSSRKLSKGEKWSLVLLSAATLAIVFLSAWQMKGTIFSPFERESSGEMREYLDENRQINELRNKDTDQDSLNDFDELYVHGTSPYLPDTDSDGITDSAEIDAGKDPNCPEGQDCYLLQGDAEEDEEVAESGDEMSEAEKAALILDLPVEELRSILISAGVPADTLNQLSDEELKQMVADILADEAGAQTGSATSTNETTSE